MNSTHDQTHPSEFGLKSTNVMLEHYPEPVEAVILIKNDKIHDVKILAELNTESLEILYQQWDIQDYGNLLIFPGIIDCNVHLHSGSTSEWDNISYATRLAAMGGITTVIDNPIMTKSFKTGSDYLQILKERIEALKIDSQVDFGVYGLLEERTKDKISQMVELGVMGLKCYLLSCFQHNIGHMDPEHLTQWLDTINTNHPGLLLAFHPEIATDRELYHSSPCRFIEKETRLDPEYEIMPLEFGGAANKGSFLDDFKKIDDEEDFEGPNSAINTPSKLKSQIKKSKEKAEVNSIAYFELLSYGGSEQKTKSNCSSSESDDEFKSNQAENSKSETGSGSEKLKISLAFAEEGTMSKKTHINSLNKDDKIIEVDSDDNVMTPTPNRLTTSNDSLVKKSFFAPKITCIEEDAKTDIVGILKITKNEEEIEKDKPDFTKKYRSKASEGKKVPKKTSFDLVEISPSSEKSLEGPQLPEPDNLHLEKRPEDESDLKMTKTFATRLALFPTVKSSIEITSGEPEKAVPIYATEKNEEKLEPSQDIPKFKKKLEIETQFEENSPGPRKNSSNSSLSPVKKTLTPSSSLLNRRMSQRISGNLPQSTKSNISSPSSDLSRVSFLDTNKSPNNFKKTENLFNKSYRVFLANRPPGWEENGLTKIILAISEESSLRIFVQNLSLASSFLKIRQMKKANEKLSETFYGESSISYLVFSEKVVKKGETKYKAAPPLREKENRRLLVENFRLGGIDIISSYHFYVPPRYKTVGDGNFRRAFSGFNAIGFTLQASWTVLYNHYNQKSCKFSQDLFYQKKTIANILRKILEALCLNPAKLLKIDHRKGTIAKGKDADLIIWDPHKSSKCLDLPSNHLFCDKNMMGIVHKTFLRGKVIYDKEKGPQVQSECGKVEFISPRP